MKQLLNLTVEAEPYYVVKLREPSGKVAWLTVRGKRKWKRVTAVSYARWMAAKYPDTQVSVHLDSFDI